MRISAGGRYHMARWRHVKEIMSDGHGNTDGHRSRHSFALPSCTVHALFSPAQPLRCGWTIMRRHGSGVIFDCVCTRSDRRRETRHRSFFARVEVEEIPLVIDVMRWAHVQDLEDWEYVDWKSR